MGSLAASHLLVTEHLKQRDRDLQPPFAAPRSAGPACWHLRAGERPADPCALPGDPAGPGHRHRRSGRSVICRCSAVLFRSAVPASLQAPAWDNAREALTARAWASRSGHRRSHSGGRLSLSHEPELRGMFVTPRSIESMVRSCSHLIAGRDQPGPAHAGLLRSLSCSLARMCSLGRKCFT